MSPLAFLLGFGVVSFEVAVRLSLLFCVYFPRDGRRWYCAIEVKTTC